MKNYKALVAALCGLSIFGANAQATPVVESIGNTYETGSFATGMVGYGGFATFTSLEAFIVFETGQGSFEYQGLNVNGSAGTVVNPGYSIWTGSSSGNGSFEFFLDGNATGILQIDIIAGGLGVGVPLTGRLTYTNGNLSGWNPGTYTDHPYDRDPVPDAGSTVALLGLALFGATAIRRKLNLA